MDTINTRKRIEEDIALLKSMIYRMSGLASESLEKAVWALKNQDVEVARNVIADGDIIDELEEKLDAACMEFAARYQPLGEDLRVVVSVMHIAVDLERIGDYGENIAKAALSLSRLPQLKPLIDIPRMVEIIKEMLRLSMAAIDGHDGEMALKVFPLDDEVDDLERQIMRELLLLIMEKPERIEQSFNLMNVSRTLERAGDHATNVAERVAYMYTGRPVKAGSYRRRKTAQDDGN
ncbi:MAG: phosphate signaling complex protein PhoU [Synergistaceae bacterium]|nr:phosphate signaling complex protein PhoU [Synergistaceae bacterium]